MGAAGVDTGGNVGDAKGCVVWKSRVVYGRDVFSDGVVPDERFKPVFGHNRPPDGGIGE